MFYYTFTCQNRKDFFIRHFSIKYPTYILTFSIWNNDDEEKVLKKKKKHENEHFMLKLSLEISPINLLEKITCLKFIVTLLNNLTNKNKLYQPTK